MSVEQLSGEVKDLRVPVDVEADLVQHLLSKVAQAFGQHPANVSLVYETSVLNPLLSLKEANIQNGSTLSLVAGKARYALTVACDGTAKIWEVSSGRCLHTLGGENAGVNCACFSPNRATTLTASGSKLQLWDTTSGALIRESEQAEHAEMKTVVFSESGDEILTGFVDGTVKIIDAETMDCVRILPGHTDAVCSASFSPDNSLIATACHDCKVRIFRRTTGECVQEFVGNGHGVQPTPSGPSFSKDSSSVLFLAEDNAATLCSVETGDVMQNFETKGCGMMFVALLNPNNKLVLTISQSGEARLWSRRSGECIRRYLVSGVTCPSACFSTDGASVLIASHDTSAKLWEANTGTLLQVFRGHTQRLTVGQLS